jgi:hypothetical protein
MALTFEIPIEQQAEVFKVLGYPLPGEEVWCGIARLKPIDARKEVMPHQEPTVHSERHNATPPETGAVAFTASERGKARYASASDMERARTRAALLAKDPRFIAWIGPCREGKEDIEAAQYIRNVCCAGESRRLIAEDETCYRAFIAMETDFLISINALTEPR